MFYRLTIVQQLLALVLVPVIVYLLLTKARFFRTKARRITFRVGMSFTAALLFFLAFNALTIDGKNEAVAQLWSFVHYNTLPYAGHAIREDLIHARGKPPFITFSNGAGTSKIFFLGIPPFQLNKQAILGGPLVEYKAE